jgi:CRP-like cAMP-binding protein
VLGLLIAGGVFEQSLTGAIATSAVASVVLGLALQETLGNFFAGISLQIGQPFRLGDVIVTGGHEGRVEAFNWRATTIRTVDDALVTLPNAMVARETVEVHPRKRPTRRVLTIGATYDAPPQQVVGVVRGALTGVPGVAERPAPQVRLGSFDDSSVGYEVLYWVEDRMRAAAIDAQIRERVWYAFARNDVAIPFPHEVQVPYAPPPPMTEDPAEERARWLGEVALFAPLAPEERQRLAERARTLLYGPGETILRAGAGGGSMFVVLRGRVEIRVPQDDGRRVRVAEIASGEVMGEMSLLTGEPRSADAHALGEVELIEVRRPEMKALLEENEVLADALAAEMSLRLDQRADALARLDAEAEDSTMQASLLGRIRRFFDLG